jgi:hypothetical protein
MAKGARAAIPARLEEKQTNRVFAICFFGRSRNCPRGRTLKRIKKVGSMAFFQTFRRSRETNTFFS